MALSGRACRRKASVGRLGPENNRTVGRRMRSDDYPLGDENLNLSRRKTVKAALDEVPVIPVLLALPTFAPRPLNTGKFGSEACENDRDRSEKSAPMASRPAGMHCPTVGTAPALYPHRFSYAIEVTGHIAMPPEPLPTAMRTTLWLRPWEELPLAHDLGHTGRHG